MPHFISRFVVVALGLAFASGAFAQDTPEQIVRKTTDEIIALLKVNKDAYAKDTRKLYAMVDEKVLPVFDFERMSQWVLGRHWRTATPEQRERFVKEFRDLLVRTYATALLNYTGEQKVNILPTQNKPGSETVTVRTEIQQGGGAPSIPIHYAFYLKKPEWKVYDVVIDGVSLVTNYRSTYSAKIKEQGLDALIASIAQSNSQPVVPVPGSAKKRTQ